MRSAACRESLSAAPLCSQQQPLYSDLLGNMLVSPLPSTQADFGLSKHKYNTFCSNVHDLRGTLPYMAPEMIMDHTHVTGGST